MRFYVLIKVYSQETQTISYYLCREVSEVQLWLAVVNQAMTLSLELPEQHTNSWPESYLPLGAWHLGTPEKCFRFPQVQVYGLGNIFSVKQRSWLSGHFVGLLKESFKYGSSSSQLLQLRQLQWVLCTATHIGRIFFKCIKSHSEHHWQVWSFSLDNWNRKSKGDLWGDGHVLYPSVYQTLSQKPTHFIVFKLNKLNKIHL